MAENAQQMIMSRFNEPLSLREVRIGPLEPGQILVEIEAAGVCGSDVHMWRGEDPRTPLPMVLGHEGIGRVAQLASGMAHAVDGQRLREGDRIIWNRGVSCGRCHACVIQHEPSLCPSRWVYGIHRPADVPPYLNGSYGSHIILQPGTDLLLAPEAIAPEVLVAASCSGATAGHVFAMAEIRPGDVVVIYGPGPLGAFCAAFARAQGASEVVMVGSARSQWRMEICRALGATRTLVLSTTDLDERREVVASLTDGRGADLVIEAAGSPLATVEALEMARAGGHVSLVGYGEPKGEMAIRPFEHVVRKNLHVQGVWVSDTRHLKWALELVRSNPAGFAHLLTHRVPLQEANAAMGLVERREAMKAVLLPRDGAHSGGLGEHRAM